MWAQAGLDYAWVAELTQVVDLSLWPGGGRLIVQAEPPHPGTQLRFNDQDCQQLNVFVTNSSGAQLSRLGVAASPPSPSRRREVSSAGLANPPLPDFAHNQIWMAIVCLPADLTD